MTRELSEGRARRAIEAWGGGPLVVAHRGASGYLPEHTLEAYALAYGMGADVLEPDLVLTRDHVLICLHDTCLERVTDVAAAFPGRAREDGRFHALDFSLDEIRRLSATGGERHGLRGYGIPTFEEFLSLATHLAERVGRPVGIAPELKAPALHARSGADILTPFARALRTAGLTGPTARVIVQCFEPEPLVALRKDHGLQCPLLQLTGAEPPSAADLDRVAEYADMLGPARDAITAEGGGLVDACHARGLAVVPYTFKDEPEVTAAYFGEHRVDGLFSDFPDVALRARAAARPR